MIKLSIQNLETFWQTALNRIETQMTAATYDTWLASTRALSATDTSLTIGVLTESARAYLEQQLSPIISRTVDDLGGPANLTFTVIGAPSAPAPAAAPAPVVVPRNGDRPDGVKDSYTAYDILTTDWPEPTWAIPNLLPAGLAGLAALPKIGKSYLALQLAKAISTGADFLGHPVQQGKFLYFALEDNVQRLKSRMIQQQWDSDHLQTLNDFVVYDQFQRVYGKLDEEGAQILGQRIIRHQYTLVVIDTFSWAFPGDQDRIDQMYAVLGPVKQVALANNCCVMIIDHHNKRASSGQSIILDWLGSIGKAAITDTIWAIYREQGRTQAQLVMTGKDIEEQYLDVVFDKTTGIWSADAAAGFQLTDRRQEILDILGDLGRAKVGEIANAIEQNRGNTHKRLQEMTNAGYIIRSYDQSGAVHYELSQDYLLDLGALQVNTVNTLNSGKQLNKVNTAA